MERLQQLTVGVLMFLPTLAASANIIRATANSTLPASDVMVEHTTSATIAPATVVTNDFPLMCVKCITDTRTDMNCSASFRLVDCPGSNSACFSHTDLNENGTIIRLSLGCAKLPSSSPASNCSHKSVSGRNYTSCYCYCRQQLDCRMITNSVEASVACLSATPIHSVFTPGIKSRQNTKFSAAVGLSIVSIVLSTCLVP